MVNTSKILTVSYGTFSCTLEGFDDSFDTMKAIAEYFRDLAADDRYFGAEPPTPDAEMLARIAEREIERRVEAHQDQGKIVLRAADAPALAAANAAAEQVEEPVADEPVAEEVAVEAPVAEEAVEETVAEVEEVATADDEGIAEEQEFAADNVEGPDVQEVEEPVVEAEAQNGVDASFVMAEAAEQDVADDDTAEKTPDIQEDAAVSEEFAPVEEFSAEIGEEVGTDEAIESAEEFFANSPEVEPEVYYEPEAVEDVTAHPDPESVAAKLSRIRSVVSHNNLAEDEDDFSEDEHAQDFLDETAADLDAALAQDDEAEIENQGDDASEDDVSDADILASLVGSSAQPSDEEESTVDPAEVPADVAEDDDGLPDTLSQLLEDSITDETAKDDAVAKASDEVSDELLSEEFSSADLQSDDELDAEPLFSDDDEARDDLNARVIKMKREDIDAAEEFDGMEMAHSEDEADQENLDPVAEDETADEAHVLSPEDEEELQRELAEVDADLESDDFDTELEEAAVEEEAAEYAASDDDAEDDESSDEPIAARDGRAKFESADDQSDLERIFDEADSQLEKPESNQRRSAIQHLRAAVAATRAEKKAGADLQKNVDDSPYRSDLASVVRPRRPSTTDGARSERPSESRPAPLKLVAEQRIDTARDPIRPRRVSAAELNAATESAASESGSSFSDFAQEMGATQLPDLLEAAAAYMSDVEGRSQFSRPMLMHKLQEVEKENFSREDGLRSFGQLLREGKIQKIKGGRFTVTEDTEFRGDARHAG